MLVLDLAYDLLDDVLYRHDADGPAVLVHHDRKLDPTLLHLRQELVDPFRLGSVRGRPHQALEVGRLRPPPQEIHGRDHANHVELAVGIDGDAREAALLDEADGVVGGGVFGQGGHVHERHHDLPYRGVAEVEDLVDHLRLGGGDVGLRGLELQEELELLAGDELSGGCAAESDGPEGRADQRSRSPGHRRQDHGRQLEHREEPADQGGGPLARRRLGDDLAEDQHDRHEGDGDDEGGPAARNGNERPGGEGGRCDVSDGDAHHGCRQHALRMAERLEVARRNAVARLGQVA